MSEVKVNKISPRSGTTITLGDSGDTITIPSGVTFDASSGGLAGTLTTAAQPNITSVGTLTSFTSTGIDDNATSTAITINSSDYVGINTTSPQRYLHITGNDGASGTTAGNSDTQLFIDNAGTNGGIIEFGAIATGKGIINFSSLNGTNRGSLRYFHSDDHLELHTASSERMRIDSSGNVGIGTTSPSSKLHVNGTFTSTGIDDNATSTAITIDSSENVSFAGDISTGNNGVLNILDGDGDISGKLANQSSSAHSLEIIADPSNSGANSNMIFKIDNSEHMRIDSSGNVLVGKTASNFNNVGIELIPFGRIAITKNPNIIGTFNLLGNGEMFRFLNTGTLVGGIVVGASSTSYNTTSDYRIKENVSYDFDATSRLKQLKPARFNFIADADKTVDGFLAHEVQDVVPEAITGTKDAVQVWEEGDELPEGVSVGDNKLDENGNTIPKYQGIDQAKLVPLLVKTIQELEARITQLENA